MPRLALKRPSSVVTPNPKIFTSAENFIHEDMIATDAKELVFPGVSSCVSVTCVLKGKLTGGHFTVGTTKDELKAMLVEWKKWHDTPVTALYIAGPTEKWSDMKIAKSADDMAKLFKKEFGYTGKAYVYNQAPVATAIFRSTHTGGATAVIETGPQAGVSKPTTGEIAALKVVAPPKFETK